MCESYTALRKSCGLDSVEFPFLRAVVEEKMREPKNRTGLKGPGQRGLPQSIDWEAWLDLFIDGGIGNQFWGPGTDEKWSFPAERDEIRAFMRKMTLRTANTLNKIDREYEKEKARRELYLREDRVRAKPQIAPTIVDISSPEPQKSDNFVLETSLLGSNNFILIHGSDVPSLEHLVEQIGERHNLNQDQEIEEIKVKIGQRICNVNLNEPRDWRYISGLMVENGGSAKVVFGVS